MMIDDVVKFPAFMICLLLCFPAQAMETDPVFEVDIAPILASRCGKCHSSKVQKGSLDLSTMNGLRTGGESGEPAVSESADESLLWIMIEGGDMPPEGQPPLSDDERSLIHKWLKSGAKSNQPETVEPKKLNQHDVLQIVLLRCTTCHGARLKKGGVDLRTPTAMLKGGKNGPAVIPGDPDASLMMQRIESEACPPRELLLKFFVKRPPASEAEILREWIAAGAPVEEIVPDVATTEPDPLVTDEDRQHWAFQPPVDSVRAGSIDDFILAKLRENGLTFSPEADRDTLIRRTYLDLTGIPPTIEEWTKWHSSDAPDWHCELVDELLASPRYGERWGRYWLDVAVDADPERNRPPDPAIYVGARFQEPAVYSGQGRR